VFFRGFYSGFTEFPDEEGTEIFLLLARADKFSIDQHLRRAGMLQTDPPMRMGTERKKKIDKA